MQAIRRSLVSLKANDPLLSNWISEEKDVLKGLDSLAQEKSEANDYMLKYGSGEHADLVDITERLHCLVGELVTCVKDLSSNQASYRSHLKQVKKKCDQVHASHVKLKTCHDRLAAATKSKKPTDLLNGDCQNAQEEVNEKEAELASLKRIELKAGMHTQFDAWISFAETVSVISRFGKHFADQIPQGTLNPGQPMPEYLGKSTTDLIFRDFNLELNQVRANSKVLSSPKDDSPLPIPPQGLSVDQHMDQRRSVDQRSASFDQPVQQPFNDQYHDPYYNSYDHPSSGYEYSSANGPTRSVTHPNPQFRSPMSPTSPPPYPDPSFDEFSNGYVPYQNQSSLTDEQVRQRLEQLRAT